MATLIFDVETTGLVKFDRPPSDQSQPRLVQIGAVLFDSKRAEAGSMCFLVRPDGYVSQDGARKVHEISARRAELYGIRIRAALSVFMDMVRSASDLVAFNLEFDECIIDIELNRIRAQPPEWKRAGLRRSCAMIEAGQVANGGKSMKLPAAHLALTGAAYVPTHNGLDDARAAARIWWAICDRRAAA
ncbi:3'-5' exonuclease [Mangrovibrevibacter kandeliae]|uniref:3'-5' exonuclease n=1 Tax=Mangrovibrevibacter kandeliae TaxID=2968473 RepID=UPI0021198189|nr:3'-5' exonuclease [Aurantimonas sp. CSK15Z-1]